MAARSHGQHDDVTRALELVGDRWALLIVRDLLVGTAPRVDALALDEGGDAALAAFVAAFCAPRPQ